MLDKKAMSVVHLSLCRNIAVNTVKAKSTKEMFEMLSEMYEKPSTVNTSHLLRRPFNTKMSESGSVAELLTEFNLITTQLSCVGIEFDDKIRTLILLSSLPKVGVE